MALIVHKYGGTSMGSTERILNVAKRVAKWARAGHQMVVVPSAMSGETNRLLGLAKELAGDAHSDAYYRELDALAATGEQASSALLAIALPAGALEQLGGIGQQLLVSPGPDTCLWITNQPHLDRLSERLESSPAAETDIRAFRRLYFAQVERARAGVHVRDDDRLGGHLDVLELGKVGVRTPAEGEDDLLAGGDVVAVDEDAQRLVRGGLAHGRDANADGARRPWSVSEDSPGRSRIRTEDASRRPSRALVPRPFDPLTRPPVRQMGVGVASAVRQDIMGLWRPRQPSPHPGCTGSTTDPAW